MVVLVTGASSGLGRQTAILFARNGYDVIINYCNNLDLAKETEQEVLKYNVQTLLIKCDVSKEDEVINMINVVKKKFHKIDCVVNNAAISKDCLPFEKSVADFKKILYVNLIGTYLVSKYASMCMDKGTIINVSSNNAMDSYYPMSLDYDASKAGIISLTHNLALALAPNIRVNAIAPGWINTNMNKNMDEDFYNQECKKILLNRFADAIEIAQVIYFLASDAASYINNTVIRVDGGIYGCC